MKRWLTIILLLVWAGIAGAQTTPPMCAITGNVANADGSPYVGVIKFYNPIVQVINNIPINPMQVSTGTTPTGVIQPISLPQGAFFQITMCPSASASSGCAATFTSIVPASASANFGNMAMGVNLSPSIVASSLSVTGTTSLASTTISGPLTFPDNSTYTTAGHNNMKALGVGYAAPATTGWIQNSGVLGVGLTIPTDATGGLLTSTAGIFSPSSSSTAFQIFDAGIYPTSGGYKISSNDGSLFHMIENGTEFGIFIDNGQTTGSIWNNGRTQYLALRSTANTGSGPGLYLESGPFQALNAGIISGNPTGLNKGVGSFNGTSYYVNGSQLTQVSLGTVASMGSASVFHISNSTLNCSLTFDGLGSGHAMATCNISITWSSITGQNGSVVNIGYLPWVAASTANNSWFHVSYVSGYSGTVGCWLTATLNPGQSWVTIAYVGPTSACGASGGWLPDTNFAQTGGISLIGQYLVQ